MPTYLSWQLWYPRDPRQITFLFPLAFQGSHIFNVASVLPYYLAKEGKTFGISKHVDCESASRFRESAAPHCESAPILP